MIRKLASTYVARPKGPQQDLKFEVKIKKQNWLKMRPKGPQQDLKFEVKIKKQFS